MFRFINLLLAGSVLACGVSACTKEKEGPSEITISGTVKLMDEFGREIADKSGVTVSVEDVANSATAVTNASGAYTIKVRSGVHTLALNKQYVGIYRFVKHDFSTPNEVLPLVRLGNQSISGIYNLRVLLSADAVYVHGTMLRSTPVGLPPRQHRLFLNNATSTLQMKPLLTISGTTNDGDEDFYDIIPFTQLQAVGLPAGSTIYMRGYGDNAAADSYWDSEQDKTIYPAINSTGSNYVVFSY